TVGAAQHDDRRTHGRRRSGSGVESCGGAGGGGGPRPPANGYSADGNTGAERDGAAQADDVPDRRIRGAGADSRGDRIVWRDGVLGSAAHGGDRNTASDRGAAGRHFVDGDGAGATAQHDWRSAGYWGGGAGDAADRTPAVPGKCE